MLPVLLFILLLFASSATGQISYDARSSQQLTPPAGNTPPEQRCVVAGRVTNALTGEPVKKVVLKLTVRNSPSGRNQSAQGYGAVSEADGSFKFEDVEPGNYLLAGNRNGFLSGQYGARGLNRPGEEILLAPKQQLTNMAFPLTPQSVIIGKIVDEDGDPVSNAFVQVMERRWIRGNARYMPQGSAQSNDIGEFRMANLSPGKYYVAATRPPYFGNYDQIAAITGKPDIRPVRTYYPEATTIANATPVDIRAGQDLPGVDIRLHSAPTYHVRGRVVGSTSDKEGSLSVSVQERDDNIVLFPFGSGTVKRDRTFDIAGVAPGAYNLNVNSFTGRMRSFARQPLDVGASDVNDVVVSLAPGGTVRGQVRMEGTAPAGVAAAKPENVRVNLMGDEIGFNFAGSGEVKEDGTFAIENVLAGRYEVNLNPPPGTYLASVRAGSQELAGKLIEISQGGLGDLQIVFRYGVAEVDGTVRTPDSESSTPVASATIVLNSEAENSDGSGLHIGSTGNDGTFTIKQLPPGRYRAYALEDADSNSLEDPEVLKQLESRSIEVEVKENDHKQIQLTLVPADQYRQILGQLGVPTQ